ncbi:hypothetical protein IWQ60_008484, partial [Tieghemiomyces parasiticus]
MHLDSTVKLDPVLKAPLSAPGHPLGHREWSLSADFRGPVTSILVTYAGSKAARPLARKPSAPRLRRKASTKLKKDSLNTLAAMAGATLVISCQVTAGSLIIRLVFDRTQVAEAAVRELGRQLYIVARALTAVAEKPKLLTAMNIADVGWVDEVERQRLLQLAGTVSHLDAVRTPVHHLFIEWARNTPGGIALEHEGRTVTYAELDQSTSALAQILVRDHGARPEIRIALLLAKSIEYFVALFAVLKSGAAYVPIDPEYPDERIRYILTDSAAALVLTSSAVRATGEATMVCSVVMIDSLPASTKSVDDFDKPLIAYSSQPTDLAYIVYTSGTTGQPKGVMVEHGNLSNFAAEPTHLAFYRPGNRELLAYAIGFDAILWPTLKSLCYGGTLVLPGSDLLSDLASAHTTSVTPSFLAKLCPTDFPLLRGVISGGEPCTPHLVDTWSPHCHFSNGYGPSETTVVSFTVALEVGDPVTVGRPTRNVLAYVVDEDLRLVPVGAPGQLLIGGLGVARGYCNRPELTAQKFIANPFGPGRVYLTGDRARWLPNGHVDLLGRMDHQVKLRGFRIELEEIEAAVSSFPAVQLAVAAVQRDRLVVFVEPEFVDTTDLLGHCHARLAKFMVPDYLVPVAHLRLTANGKVDRKALPEAMESIPTAIPTEPHAFTTMELRLRESWAQVLQVDVEQIGATDDFFRIGGDSISAILLVSKWQQRGFKVTVALLYECRQIRTLATRLTSLDVTASKGNQSQGLAVASDSSLAGVELIYTGHGVSLLQPTELEFDHLLAGLTDHGLSTAEIEEIIPCTPSQSGLLVATAKDPSSYMVQAAVTLAGTVDLDRLRQAWGGVIQQHGVLRTIFVSTSAPRGNGFAQVILRSPHPAWTVVNQPPPCLTALFMESRTRGFSLPNPMVEVHVYPSRRADGYEFVLTIHHALLDGWSLSLVLRELYQRYHLRDAFRTTSAPPFRHVVETVVTQDETTARSFWSEYLRNTQPTPAPMLGKELTGEHGFAEYRSSLNIPKPDLLQAARRFGVTLSTLLKAAYAVVLSRYLGRDDIVIGFVVSGRNLDVPGIASVVGLCINTVPLRFRLTDQFISTWLEQLQAEATRMIPFEHTSLVKINAWCNPDSVSPLFHTLGAFENFPRVSIKADDVTMSPPQVLEFTEYPLSVDFVDESETVDVKCFYTRTCCGEADIDQLLHRINSVLAQLSSATADTTIDQVSRTLPDLAPSCSGQLVTAGGVQVPLATLDRYLAKQGLSSPVSVVLRDGRIVTRTLAAESECHSATALLAGLNLPNALVPTAFISLEAFPHLSGASEVDFARLGEAYLHASDRVGQNFSVDTPSRWLEVTCMDLLTSSVGKLNYTEDIWVRITASPALLLPLEHRINQRYGIALGTRAMLTCVDVPALALMINNASLSAGVVTAHSALPPGAQSKMLHKTKASLYQTRVWLACQRSEASNLFYYQERLCVPAQVTQSDVERILNQVMGEVAWLRAVVCKGEDRLLLCTPAAGKPTVDMQDAAGLFPLCSNDFKPADAILINTGMVVVVFLPESRELVIRVHQILAPVALFGQLVDEVELVLSSKPDGREFAVSPSLILSNESTPEHPASDHFDRAYWEALLADAPTGMGLPLDRPRPRAPAFRSASILFDLSPEFVNEWAAYTNGRRLSPVSLWAAMVGSYLGRIGSADDVLVDVTLSRNLQCEIFNSSKLHHSVCPVRVQATATTASLADLSAALSEQLDHSMQHLISNYDPYTVLSHLSAHPLWHPVRVGLEFNDAERVANDQSRAALWHDLAFYINVTSQRPTMTLKYSPDLLDSSTILRFGANMLHYFQVAISDTQPLYKSPLVCPAEEHQLLREFGRNPGKYDPSKSNASIVSLIRDSVQRSPNTIALEAGTGTVTYARMNIRVEGFAYALQTCGIRPQDRVAVFVESQPATVVAMLSLWLLRAVYVPVDCTLPEQRQRYMVEAAQCTHALNMTGTDVTWRETLPGLALLQTQVEFNLMSLPYTHYPDDLAYIVFTSGTTGQPKGVMIRHAGLTNLLLAPETTLCPDPGMRCLQAMAVGFDGFILVALSPLCTSSTVVFSDGDIPATLGRVDVALLTPSVLGMLNPTDYPNLRRIDSAGEGLPVELAGKWLRNCAVRNLYGPTEITVCSHAGDIQPDLPVTIGRPVAGSGCYIVDSHDQLVPIGVAGEICVDGAGVSMGYVNRPDLNSTKFIHLPYSDGPVYRSGDFGRWLPSGEVECLGRRDDQIKLRGFRIEPTEVETVIRQHAAVESVAVAVQNGKLYAFVTPQGASVHEVKSFTATRLPAHMIPTAIFTIAQIPLTHIGKTDRQRLLELLPGFAGDGDGRTIRGARNDVEHLIVEAMAQTLGIAASEIDIRNSFFQMGGDSIAAIGLSSQCRGRGLRLSIAQIFTHSSPAALAKVADLDESVPTMAAYQPFMLVSLLEQGLAKLKGEAASNVGVDPEAIEDIMPVSSLQQGFLVSTLRNSSAYMAQMIYELTGPLNVDKFRQSWQRVTLAHQILRTKFYTPADQSEHAFLQAILRDADFEWDYNAEPQTSFDQVEKQHLREDRERGFTLDGPLLRLAVYRGSDDRHLFCTTFHHALLDAWSVDIILAESLQHYHHVQVRPRSQYRDFIRQISCLDQSSAAEFWSANLRSVKLHPVLQFPMHPDVNSTEYGQVHHTMSSSLTAVHTYCRGMGLTVNSLLRAVWALTLARYLGESEEITFGVLMSGRNVPVPGIEGMVGMCINTLPFRAQFPSDGDMASFLHNVNVNSGVLTEYEQCSLVNVKRWADIGADVDLFTSLLVYDNYATTASTFAKEIDYTPRSGQNFTEYAYTVGFSDRGDSLLLNLNYQTQYCNQVYAGYLCAAIDQCLAVIVSGKAQGVGDNWGLPAVEQALVKQWAAGTSINFPQKGWLAHQLFTQNLATCPDTIALETAFASYTYAEVYQQVCGVAVALRSRGFLSGDRAALLYSRCPEFIFSYLAVLIIDGVCVPMDVSNSPDRLRYQYELLGGPWLLTIADHLQLAQEGLEASIDRVLLVKKLPTDSIELAAEPSRSHNDVAYIAFTSGTTGRPKGIQVRHESLINFVVSWSDRVTLPAGCRFLQTLNISFDGCLIEIFGTFHRGGTLVLQDGDILDSLRRVDTCLLIPSMLTALDPRDYPNLQLLVAAGEPLPFGVAQRWRQHMRVVNVYGPTEVTIVSHSAEIELNQIITVGPTLDNVECYILDAAMRPTPIGVPGELYIGGVGVSNGYVEQPDLTREAFQPNPFGTGTVYRSGDLGCWLPDGQVQIAGRRDHQVKLRGFRIELGELEATCQTFAGMASTVALVKDKALVLYAAPSSLDVADLRHHIADTLPYYMIPDHVITLDQLPLTSVGKTDRKALQALPLPQLCTSDNLDADLPLPPAFDQVSHAVQAALGIASDQVAPRRSFFQLGGDSISAIRFASLLRKQALQVTVAQIFAASSLIDLAVEIALETEQATGGTLIYRAYSLLKHDGADCDRLIYTTLEAANVTAEDVQDITPVTSLQFGFLFNTLRDPSAYMVQSTYEVRGPLDVERLRHSWEQVGLCHEVLRAKFVAADAFSDYPFLQLLMKKPEFTWSYSVVDEGSPEDAESDYLVEDRRQGFALDGPLIRLAIFHLQDTRHLMCFTFHHALLDAWSTSIVLGEVLEYYHGIEPQPRTQFHAFISCVTQDSQEKEATFWQDYLSGVRIDNSLRFPVLPNAHASSVKAVQHTFSVDVSLIQSYCASIGITLNSLLRAIWALTLARYMGHTDEVTFGVLMSGRNLPVPGIEGMVGMCINTLPFRARWAPDELITDFVRRVNRESGTLIAHEQSSLVDVKRWAQLPADAALFHSLLIYDNYEEYQASPDQTEIDFVPRDGYNETEYVYGVHFGQVAGSLEVQVKYQTLYCGVEFAQLLCRFMDHCLGQIVNQPATRIANVFSLPESELARIHRWSTGTTVQFPQKDWLAYQLFTQNLTVRPEAVAVESATHSFGYAKVYEHVCDIASALRRRGFKPGHMAALLFARCPEFIFSYLAVQLLGGVCVPMDVKNASDRLLYMVSVLDKPWLLSLTTHTHEAEGLGIDSVDLFYVDQVMAENIGRCDFQPDTSRQPDDLMYIMFTSGTTGQPKGVPIRHRSLVNFALSREHLFGLTVETRFLLMSNIAFDASLNAIFSTFHAGGTLVLHDGDLLDDLKRVNTCHATPSVLAAIEPGQYPDLTTVIAGGEALSYSVAQAWSRHARVYNTFGPTETTIDSHGTLFDPNGPVSIGYPVHNMQGYVLDNDMEPVPIGVPGELYIGGAGVAVGYWKQPELTAKAFVANPFGPGKLYRTGDIVSWLPSGHVYYVGRRDHQVKLRGFRIELGEIESRCQTLPNVANAVALVKDNTLVVYLAPDNVDTVSLRHHLAAKLPDYMVPQHLITMDTLPTTTVGKADRRALLSLPLPEDDGGKDEIDGRHSSPAFTALREAVAGVLHISPSRAGPRASFFRLGGDSISAIRLASTLRGLDFVVTVAQIFQCPTLGDLGTALVPLELDLSSRSAYAPFSLLGDGSETDTLRQHVTGALGLQSEEIQDVLPVLGLQQGFLVSTLKDPSAYMVQESFELLGRVDTGRLRQSWLDTLNSHTILRTKFVVADEFSNHAFLQVVLAQGEVEWSDQTLSGEDLQQVETNYFTRERERGFDFRSPLIRLALLRVHDQRHILFFSFHHALLDAWASSIIKAETLERYHGRPTQPRIQYHDYMARVYMTNQSNPGDFWRSNLNGIKCHPAIQFPIQSAANGPRHSTVDLALSPSLSAIQGFCREQGLTFNSLLRSVWALALARYHGEEEEVTFGVLMSGRNVPLPGVEGMVGMCINTLPFRVRFVPHEPLVEYIRRINQESGTLTAYEQCGLIDIKRWTGVDSDKPLFQSLLVYDNHPEDNPSANDDFAYQLRSGQNLTEYAYTVSFTEEGDGLQLDLQFLNRYCDAHYARLMCQYVDHCMSAIVVKSASQIPDLMSLPPSEEALVNQWAAGHTADFPQKDWLAHQFFTQNLAIRPDAVALESATAQFTYAEVYRRACAIATALRDQGAYADDRVALLFSRSPEFIFSYLAVLLLGGVVVCMEANNALDRLSYMMNLLEGPWVITNSDSSELVTKLELEDGRVVYADQVLTFDTQHQALYLPKDRTQDSLAYIVFTSGTTGRPKGVKVAHRSLVNFVLAAGERLRLPADCRFLQALNITFDPLHMEVLGTFHFGGTLVLQDGELLDDLRRVSACILVPSMLTALDPTAYPNLTTLIAGGEALPPTVAEKWVNRAHLHNFYGPSEATIASHSKHIIPGGSVTIGTSLANMQCHILDERMHPVPIGVPGEICIGGAAVSEGYWRQPTLADTSFISNPFGPGRLYRTGDLGCWLANGEVHVLGRKDFQVKLRGFRIELGEIESTCQSYPGIANAVALIKDKRLLGYVAPSTIDIAELLRYVTSILPYYMVPELVIPLDTLPLTSIGKVDRKALQALPLPEEPHVGGSDDLPVSETFTTLRCALAEVLNLDPVRVTPSASFLRLGGDSISAIQLSSRCKKYGLKLTVADILKYPTLARLEQCAELITDRSETKYRMDPTGPVPFTAIERHVIPSLRNVNHFNQSFLVKCRLSLALPVLQEAVRALVTHHDILRLRLTNVDGEWNKEILPLPADTSVEGFLARFATVIEDDIPLDDYEAWVYRMQQTINVEFGPIMVCALLSVDGKPHVYLTVHHLAVDFVSWRILLEDFETLLTGGTLPEKTLSFREWSTLITEHARTLPDDLWPEHSEVSAIPFDHDPLSHSPATYRTVKSVQQTLGLELSELLYGQAAAQADASPQEFMVTALVMALTDSFNVSALEIDMEGHGRRPWSADIDVSRTLGWFTSLYPVAFHTDQTQHYSSVLPPLRSLAHVKQRLRSVPDSGFPYGLLKYVKSSVSTQGLVSASPPPPSGVVFNYAGRFEQLTAKDAFWTPIHMTDSWSHDLSLDEPIKHALSTSGSYNPEVGLILDISCPSQLYNPETVHAVASQWKTHLASLVQAAAATPAPCRTPSDFPLSGLSESAFGVLTTEILPQMGLSLDDVEDMYPCLPIQEGLLLATLKDPAAYM